jgi:hypothetical protein
MTDAADWTLDPRLEADTIALGDLPLSRVLLMDDANYPWLILVSRFRSSPKFAARSEANFGIVLVPL